VHGGLDPVLTTLEVDLAVEALGAATTVTGGLAAVVVAATRLLQTLGEALLGTSLRDLRVVVVGNETKTRAGGFGLANGHALVLQPLEALEDGNDLTGSDRDDRLLPIARAALNQATALRLTL